MEGAAATSNKEGELLLLLCVKTRREEVLHRRGKKEEKNRAIYFYLVLPVATSGVCCRVSNFHSVNLSVSFFFFLQIFHQLPKLFFWSGSVFDFHTSDLIRLQLRSFSMMDVGTEEEQFCV